MAVNLSAVKPVPSNTDDWAFLEEFRKPTSRMGIKTTYGLQIGMVLGAILVAVLVNVLAHFGSADLFVLRMSAVLHDSAGSFTISATSEHVYGFFAEFNHGFFYCFIAPIFIGLGIQMCRCAGQSIHELLGAGLIEEKRQGALTAFIGRINKFSLRILFGLIALLILSNFVEEYGSLWELRHLQNQGRLSKLNWDEIGYVQAKYLAPWVSTYNELPGGEHERAALLKEKIFDEELSGKLANQLAFGAKYAHWDLSGLANQNILESNGAVDPQLTRVNLITGTDSKVHVVTVTASQAGGLESYSLAKRCLFHLFLVMDLVMEGTFHGFVGWMLFKISAYIFLMFNLLPSRGTKDFNVNPFLSDGERRFGMDPVFRVYNLIALTISVGSSALILQGINTTSARTSNLHLESMQLLQVAALLTVGLSLIVLVCGPAILFRQQLREMQLAKLRQLEGKLQEASKSELNDQRRAIFEEMRLVRSQTMWPRTDAAFLSTIAFSLICIVFPFPVIFNLAPTNAQNWISIADKLADDAHQGLKALYGY